MRGARCGCGCHSRGLVKLAPHHPMPKGYACQCLCHLRTRQPAWWAPEPANDGGGRAAEEAAAAEAAAEAARLAAAEDERQRKLRMVSDGTVWHLAAQGDHAGVSRLVDSGFVAVDARDPWTGRTALHKACRAGRLRVVRALLKRGADVNARNDHGWTPLMDACASGAEGVAEALLDAGAAVTGAPGRGREQSTPAALLRLSRSPKDSLFVRLQQEANLQAALAAPETLVGRHIEIASRRRTHGSKWKAFSVVAWDAERAAHFVISARGKGHWLHLRKERLRLMDTTSRAVADHQRALAKQRPPPPTQPAADHLGGALLTLGWSEDAQNPIIPRTDRFEVAFGEQSQGRQVVVCVLEPVVAVRLKPGKVFNVRVRGHNANGWGLWSPALRNVAAVGGPEVAGQVEAYWIE